ncbi:hypothetical protein BU24DRAFT_456368 [Aaosphaeria arxii CBS 175.79]|uniref:F-box domain-containing protein n=1 Tax=Aaosphaeria arxii CBS 175.79 TaxID=1450172 RepID=A0A6A5X610_9PLEO|nr:uncharacterized protein BU24DRAFT_456368 [Aaosphaeria arxii CBS 175.79]KAF2008330.1 hypothetical protein BU24DRAFT_456368 [Aaosphaeria arxii CBS 175.79]
MDSPPTLLTLPTEVRLLVYEYLLSPARYISIGNSNDAFVYVSILRVCKQVYYEACPILYSNELRFAAPPHLDQFLGAIDCIEKSDRARAQKMTLLISHCTCELPLMEHERSDATFFIPAFCILRSITIKTRCGICELKETNNAIQLLAADERIRQHYDKGLVSGASISWNGNFGNVQYRTTQHHIQWGQNFAIEGGDVRYRQTSSKLTTLPDFILSRILELVIGPAREIQIPGAQRNAQSVWIPRGLQAHRILFDAAQYLFFSQSSILVDLGCYQETNKANEIVNINHDRLQEILRQFSRRGLRKIIFSLHIPTYLLENVRIPAEPFLFYMEWGLSVKVRISGLDAVCTTTGAEIQENISALRARNMCPMVSPTPLDRGLGLGYEAVIDGHGAARNIVEAPGTSSLLFDFRTARVVRFVRYLIYCMIKVYIYVSTLLVK